jgi:hypothetical protein
MSTARFDFSCDPATGLTPHHYVLTRLVPGAYRLFDFASSGGTAQTFTTTPTTPNGTAGLVQVDATNDPAAWAIEVTTTGLLAQFIDTFYRADVYDSSGQYITSAREFATAGVAPTPPSTASVDVSALATALAPLLSGATVDVAALATDLAPLLPAVNVNSLATALSPLLPAVNNSALATALAPLLPAVNTSAIATALAPLLPIFPAVTGLVTAATSTSITATMTGLGASVTGSMLVNRRLMYGGVHRGVLTAQCSACTITGTSAAFTFPAAQAVPANGEIIYIAAY